MSKEFFNHSNRDDSNLLALKQYQRIKKIASGNRLPFDGEIVHINVNWIGFPAWF